MIGRQIAQYRILAKLGEGGMGVVYKAEDVRLKRLVAIKVIQQTMRSEPEKERFSREAQAAASLQHPNICTVYGFDEVDGILFQAMAYLEGRSLADLVEEGPRTVAQSLNYAAQIASALSEAHKKNVVHRDIKSANIIISADDHASVLDFGLAKLQGLDRLTVSGSAIGTPVYMSPEQAMGQDVDARTDIWSLGVVLYEMLTGSLPFDSSYQLATMYSILNEEPKPVRELRPDAPADVELIMRSALAKQVGERYQTAREFEDDLRELGQGRPLPARRPVGSAHSTVAPDTLGVATGDWTAAPPSADTGRTSIAVVPFRSLSTNAEHSFIADGLSSEIVSDLAGVPGLRVAPSMAAAQFKDQTSHLSGIAQALNVQYVLTGTLRIVGDKARLAAELSDAGQQQLVWARTYNKDIDDLFELQAQIARAIAGATGGEIIRARSDSANHARPEDLDALGLVRKAYHFWNYAFDVHGVADALNMLRHAIELSPNYAIAHAYLGHYLAQKVVNFISEDPDGERLEAMQSATTATNLAPGDTEVLENAGLVWYAVGEYRKAVLALRRAVEVAPYNLVAWGYLALSYAWGGESERVDDAHNIIDRLLADAPDHPSVPYWLYFKYCACARDGDFVAAADFAERCLQLQPAYFLSRIGLANAFGNLGRFEDAREQMEIVKSINPGATEEAFLREAGRITGSPDRLEAFVGGLRKAGIYGPL